MEISANMQNIVVSEPSRQNVGGDGKTGLERVTDAIAQGKKIREAGDTGAASSTAGGGSDMNEIVESIKKMIELLQKQIDILTKSMEQASDPQMKQTMQAQLSAMQTQMLELQSKLIELTGGIDFQA